jgi:hypothetical protein
MADAERAVRPLTPNVAGSRFMPQSAGPGSGYRRQLPTGGRALAVDHALIVFPVLVTLYLFLRYYSAHQIAVDFHHDFWVAGLRVREGLSPYDWTRQQIVELFGFPYPAPAALMFVPFSLIPRAVSDPVFMAVLLASCLLALRILDVRDWRLYMIVLLWWPVINAWQAGNVTLLLLCGIAATWRCRNSPVAAAVLTALMISLKPIVWPLALWLLVTRRFRAAAYSLAFTLALNAIAWAVVGFGQLVSWWHLLATQTELLYRQGYGLIAVAAHLGVGRTDATVLEYLVTAALALGCLRLGWNGRERGAFTLAVALMLVSSPRVDNHYFALLIVPLAIARPRLSWAWLPPLVLWLCPATKVAGWQLALAWVTLGALTLWLIRQPEPPASASASASASAARGTDGPGARSIARRAGRLSASALRPGLSAHERRERLGADVPA